MRCDKKLTDSKLFYAISISWNIKQLFLFLQGFIYSNFILKKSKKSVTLQIKFTNCDNQLIANKFNLNRNQLWNGKKG